MSASRDEAVRLATVLFRKLFERVWMPWNPSLERAVAKLIDLIIAAAVEQMQTANDDRFLRDLEPEQVHAERHTRRLTQPLHDEPRPEHYHKETERRPKQRG